MRRMMDLPPLHTPPKFGMWMGMATVREEKSRLAFIILYEVDVDAQRRRGRCLYAYERVVRRRRRRWARRRAFRSFVIFGFFWFQVFESSF